MPCHDDDQMRRDDIGSHDLHDIDNLSGPVSGPDAPGGYPKGARTAVLAVRIKHHLVRMSPGHLCPGRAATFCIECCVRKELLPTWHAEACCSRVATFSTRAGITIQFSKTPVRRRLDCRSACSLGTMSC